MSKIKELIKNTGIIAVGKMSSQLITFLLLPLYTSILTTEEYGTVDLLLSYLQLLLPIVNLQLDQAIFRFLVTIRGDKKQCETVVTTMTYFSVLQLIIYVVIFMIAQLFISSTYKWFFLINIVFSTISSLTANCARGLGKNTVYSIHGVIGVIVNIVFNIVLLTVFDMRVEGMLIASGVASAVSGMYCFISTKMY